MREGWSGWVRRLTAIDFSRQTRGLFVPLSILSGRLFPTFPPPLSVFLVRSYSAFRLSSSLFLAPANTISLCPSRFICIRLRRRPFHPPPPHLQPSPSVCTSFSHVFVPSRRSCTWRLARLILFRTCVYVSVRTYVCTRLACVRACKRSSASTSVRHAG